MPRAAQRTPRRFWQSAAMPLSGRYRMSRISGAIMGHHPPPSDNPANPETGQ